MKKSLALVLGFLLVFGLVLVSCESGGGGTAPKVTIKSYAWADPLNLSTPKTEFALNDRIVFIMEITDPDKDIKGYGYTMKRGSGELIQANREYDLGSIPNSDTCYYPLGGPWTFASAGTYVIEGYAFDVKGNKSITATASITVQ